MTINLTKYNALIHRAIIKVVPSNSYSRFIHLAAFCGAPQQ